MKDKFFNFVRDCDGKVIQENIANVIDDDCFYMRGVTHEISPSNLMGHFKMIPSMKPSEIDRLDNVRRKGYFCSYLKCLRNYGGPLSNIH